MQCVVVSTILSILYDFCNYILIMGERLAIEINAWMVRVFVLVGTITMCNKGCHVYEKFSIEFYASLIPILTAGFETSVRIGYSITVFSSSFHTA